MFARSSSNEHWGILYTSKKMNIWGVEETLGERGIQCQSIGRAPFYYQKNLLLQSLMFSLKINIFSF